VSNAILVIAALEDQSPAIKPRLVAVALFSADDSTKNDLYFELVYPGMYNCVLENVLAVPYWVGIAAISRYVVVFDELDVPLVYRCLPDLED
jgi:hypothetical protein